MIARRKFIGAFAGGFAIAPALLFAQRQAAKSAHIGRLSPLSAEADVPSLQAFRKGLRDHGWVEGQSFVIEPRFADGKPDELPRLAADLVRQHVDIILTGSSAGALAAKRVTDTIPIVMVTTGDPVGDGIVTSLARPGGNVTGVTALGQALSSKRLELITQAVPGVTRVAILFNPDSLYTKRFLQDIDGAARTLGLKLQMIETRGPRDFQRAFATMVTEGVGAILVQADTMLITHRRSVVELVARSRIPAVYGEREFITAGGLMFYGASLADMYEDAAGYVDKILKGARPADLPIEQPTKLELVINTKSAKSLGITIPQSLLVRANVVIE